MINEQLVCIKFQSLSGYFGSETGAKYRDNCVCPLAYLENHVSQLYTKCLLWPWPVARSSVWLLRYEWIQTMQTRSGAVLTVDGRRTRDDTSLSQRSGPISPPPPKVEFLVSVTGQSVKKCIFIQYI